MIAYGEGLLKRLIQSKMANEEDKQVLDAIWTKSKRHMEDDNIQQLIRDYAAAGLTEEERSSIEGFMDDSPAPGDNQPKEER